MGRHIDLLTKQIVLDIANLFQIKSVIICRACKGIGIIENLSI